MSCANTQFTAASAIVLAACINPEGLPEARQVTLNSRTVEILRCRNVNFRRTKWEPDRPAVVVGSRKCWTAAWIFLNSNSDDDRAKVPGTNVRCRYVILSQGRFIFFLCPLLKS